MKIAMFLEPEDQAYLGFFKPLLHGHQVPISFKCPDTAEQAGRNVDAVITTRVDLVKKLVFNSSASVDNYAGSLINKYGKPYLVINPIRDLISSATGTFITKRYITKLTKPDSWFKASPFTWNLCDELNVGKAYQNLSTSALIAIDIETTRGAPNVILCVSYTGVWFGEGGSFRTHSFVIPFDSLENVKWVRKFNDLPQPKIFQNGLFDNAYFLRFACPVRNWLLDTLEFFHSWYSELPKDLGYITLFLLREVEYWKDEAHSGDAQQFYQYNAKDGWATANSLLSLLTEAPPWVLANYKQKFPLVVPCLAANMEGMKRDEDKCDPEHPDSLFSIEMRKVEESLGSLRRKIGIPSFNPGSWQQLKILFKILGGQKLLDRFDSTDEKTRGKIKKLHPINAILLDEVDKYKESKKLVGTYLGAKTWFGRILYQMRTSGTDTNRLSCTQSPFEWTKGKKYGFQIHNVPKYAKQVTMADEGFHLAEMDNKQSEAYCLAYTSGDENLIATLASGRDFHSVNIERFFGIPYESVWDMVLNETKNLEIRDLSKRVNHGTAYVMQEATLLETMGLENVIKAQVLLKLPSTMRPLEVCAFLLSRYFVAYPKVKSDYYPWIKSHVSINHTLVSALGWTRYCFGNPARNSQDFKALVAHVPQNLSVSIINRGLVRVFCEVQIPNWRDFRIKAQVHDSVLAQYRIGRLDLVLQARGILEQNVGVTDVKGIHRVMRIPVDLKAEAVYWSDIKKVKYN